jgi:hypothetical protein
MVEHFATTIFCFASAAAAVVELLLLLHYTFLKN